MLNSIMNWISSPFNSGMSAQRWFAFVGLILVIWIVWGSILKRMDV